MEELLEASRIPMEQREAARKMGSRFAKTIEKLGLSISETGIFREYLDARKGKAVNHCCIYGVFCVRNADSSGRGADTLSICPDICNRHQLRKNNPPQPDIPGSSF